MGVQRDRFAIRILHKARGRAIHQHQHQRIERLHGGKQILVHLTRDGVIGALACDLMRTGARRHARAGSRPNIQEHRLVQPDARARRRKSRARRGGQLVGVRHAYGRIHRPLHG